MCGIVGILHHDRSRPVDRRVLAQMTDTMWRRGPDGAGLMLAGNVGLGHRRLSIIDLAGGAQPMSIEGGRYSISYNGEVYNYRALRRELEAGGESFSTASDTEVVLRAFARRGRGFLDALNGMFALAIYDAGAETLTLARDRLGIKPLFYAEHDGSLIFASEPKAILAYPGFAARLNPKAVSAYLSCRYVPGEESFFEGIRQLRPAATLTIKAGGQAQIDQWYRLPYEPAPADADAAEMHEQLRELLTDSVELRMIADVPVGAYLSGGLDSSLLAALMAQSGAAKTETFSIGFPEQGFNEFEYSREVARKIGADHHELTLDGAGYLDLLPEVIRFRDAPLGVPNEAPLYVMSRELKNYFTVVLSGEGADETFCGYGRMFASPYDAERSLALQAGTLAMDDAARGRLEGALGRAYAGFGDFADQRAFFLHRYHYVPLARQRLLLGDGYHQASGELIGAECTGLFGRAAGAGLTRGEALQRVFLELHMQSLLGRLDATTMGASVEGRVPFLDHRLVEFALRLPWGFKLPWRSPWHALAATVMGADEYSEVCDNPKAILRDVFGPLLPPRVVSRRKVGFPVPLAKWFGTGYRDWLQDVLTSERAARRGIFVKAELERTMNDPELANKPREGQMLWMAANLELFARGYLDGAGEADPPPPGVERAA